MEGPLSIDLPKDQTSNQTFKVPCINIWEEISTSFVDFMSFLVIHDQTMTF